MKCEFYNTERHQRSQGQGGKAAYRFSSSSLSCTLSLVCSCKGQLWLQLGSYEVSLQHDHDLTRHEILVHSYNKLSRRWFGGRRGGLRFSGLGLNIIWPVHELTFTMGSQSQSQHIYLNKTFAMQKIAGCKKHSEKNLRLFTMESSA